MIISGKEISVKIKDQLKEEVSKIKETYKIVIPHWETSLRICMKKLMI